MKTEKILIPSVAGIYTITNSIDQKVYVGFATNCRTRCIKHRYELRDSKHTNSHLQRAWNKYGERSFKFELLEEAALDFLPSLENYWCNMLDSHNHKYGYNTKPTGCAKYTGHSEETKEKLRNSSKGYCMRKVVQLTANYQFIKEYNSYTEAALDSNVPNASISNAVKRGYRVRGFRYMQLEDFNKTSNGKETTKTGK